MDTGEAQATLLIRTASAQPSKSGTTALALPGRRPGHRASRAPTEADQAIGLRIQALRRAKGITQRDLSQAIGITGPMMHRYEKGTARISAGRLMKVASVLEVEIDVLLSGGAGHPARELAGTSQEAASLLAAFHAIPTARQRRAVLTLARSLASEVEVPDAEDPGEP